VVGFRVPGSSQLAQPGTSTVPVVDPVTGVVLGTLAIKPDGAYTFTPTPGYLGPVPPIAVVVASSDGQSKEVPMSLAVNQQLRDANEDPSVAAGGVVRLNVLDNAQVPAGTTVRVSSFSLPGSSVVHPAGPNPVAVVDPVSGRTAGTVTLQPNGTFTFTAGSGFTGQAPPIVYDVVSSDGQTSPGAVTVSVQPGEPWALANRAGYGVTRVIGHASSCCALSAVLLRLQHRCRQMTGPSSGRAAQARRQHACRSHICLSSG
jgi:hypothetical protein